MKEQSITGAETNLSQLPCRRKVVALWVMIILAVIVASWHITVNNLSKTWKISSQEKTPSTPASIRVYTKGCDARSRDIWVKNSQGNTTERNTSTSDTHMFVALNPGSLQGRLGNKFFKIASLLLVARLTGRIPLIPRDWLDDTFDLQLDRVHYSAFVCPCFIFNEQSSLQFDERLLNLADVSANTILLNGYFQSWKYLQYTEDDLRCRLKFRKDITKAAEKYVNKHVPSGWENGTYARVGVHVRRGDILSKHFQKYGYTVPTMVYFQSAINYFQKQYSRIHLVVTSDDVRWVKTAFKAVETDKVKVTVSEGNSASVDLAILALSDALILSIGSYGRSAAWLANVTTIYYKDWPRYGTDLYRKVRKEDVFPPDWIGM